MTNWVGVWHQVYYPHESHTSHWYSCINAFCQVALQVCIENCLQKSLKLKYNEGNIVGSFFQRQPVSVLELCVYLSRHFLDVEVFRFQYIMLSSCRLAKVFGIHFWINHSTYQSAPSSTVATTTCWFECDSLSQGLQYCLTPGFHHVV